MKKIFFLVSVIVLLSCNTEQKNDNRLLGNFKYSAYYWNDGNDSVGISLVHYFEIYKDGNYKLILRDKAGNASYYYGYVDNRTMSALVNFTADSSYKKEYLGSDSAHAIYNGPTYKFDYVNNSGEKEITFKPPYIDDVIKNLQSKLDSVINAPGKKQSASFNINDYLKKIIKKDSSARLHVPPAKH